MKKSISLFLLATILLQCCAVYEKIPVSLTEAQNKGMVKVVNTHGVEFVFEEIYLEDSSYFGVTKKNITHLDSTYISSIHLQDIKKSNIKFLLVSVIITLGITVPAMYLVAYETNY